MREGPKRWWLVVLLGAIASLASACGEAPSSPGLNLEASFAPGVPRAARDEAVRAEAYLVDSCDSVVMPERPSDAIGSTYILRDEREGPRIPPPEPGDYGLYALALDSSCAVVAAGCTPVTITDGSNETLAVEMTPYSGAGCSADEQCSIETGECSAGGTGGAGGNGGTGGTSGAGGSWLDPNWLNRARISFDNSAQTTDNLDDFPLLVTIDTSKLPSLDLSATVGADIRFTDAITGAELNYEVQSWNQATGEATIWVQVPRIDAGSATDHIYIYYNYNGTATYDQSAADEAAVWPSGTGVYHLEEDPGPGNTGDIKDSDANANDGTAQSGFAINDLVAGQIGNGIEWESGDDVITFGSTDVGDTFRISAWVKPTDNGGLHTVVANAGPGDSTDGFRFYISDSGQIRFSTGNGSAGNEANSSDGAIDFGQWNHIAIDVDRTTGTAVVYHKGENVTADGTVLTDFNTSSDWVIGTMKSSINEGNNFVGVIDEVRIGNSTQTADWAKAEYLTQSGADAFNRFASEESVTLGG